jgi:hypothetical protein
MNPKYIAAAAIVIAAQAHAGDLFYAPNQANGAIVLTDVEGRCPQGSKAYYMTDSAGQVGGSGCWMYSNPWVYTRDMNGVAHQYLIDQFTATDYARAKYAAKSGESM